MIFGLLMEDVPDWRKWKENDPRVKRVRRLGTYVIVLGALVESVQTISLDIEASKAWKMAQQSEQRVQELRKANDEQEKELLEHLVHW